MAAGGRDQDRINLADILLQTSGDGDQARAILDAVAAGSSEKSRVLAKLAFREGDEARAEKLLRDAIKTDPRNLKALLDLGVFLDLRQRTDEARPYFEKLVQVESGTKISDFARKWLEANPQG